MVFAWGMPLPWRYLRSYRILKNIKLVLGYDGSDFAGFARQPGERTVEGVLAEALHKLTGERIKVTYASRTDCGVHAAGQTVNFKTSSKIPTGKFADVLDRLLPPDVFIRSAEEVPLNFNARVSARGKLYSYMLICGRRAPAALRRFCWEIYKSPDLKIMKSAAKALVGRKDFSSFGSRDRRRPLVNPVRRIRSIRFCAGNLKKFFGDLSYGCGHKAIRIDFRGDSFLYKMVRTLVGTLVDVGAGRIPKEKVRAILISKSRNSAGRTAPAKGLTLVKVEY